MLDDMRVNDEQLDASDIRQIESADEVAHFFAKLRYDVDVRTTIPLDTPVYTSSQDMKVQINHHELIATDPEDEDIRVYLFEVRSVTAKLRNDLARGFLKTTDQKVLLVLTADYEDIEFVYLERSRQRSRRKGLTLKSTIRPIPLTVNRLNPDPVALRVLKRFTFTEEDSDYQWEKLRSAYMLAEWSEEYFNNRALFSDYYLTQRLTDEKITPEWREDVRPIGREVFKHLTTARRDYTRQTEDVIRRGLYEPLFERLGFTYTEQKSSASAAEEPDYLLYAPGDTDQPIAAALTYVWNRNLDDVDESRELDEDQGGTPFEIPGAMVVSLLEAQVAPWVIVTNGKLWRLYSSTASNKATNYYEIDLEEAIAARTEVTDEQGGVVRTYDERVIALKYWWLFFRREAFTGFLDTVLEGSAKFAKDLGDRLKDRVFVEIFPQFAKGFIADMRAQGVTELDLDTVFSGTMTFLYRLMFILYAESLELLPVNEANGYRQLSLYRLKDEIASAGGDVEDTAPETLAAHYSDTSTDLYTRLKELFHVIDDGSDQMNMPTYNGGLFSQESWIGAFLEAYAIPDRYLAIGLDRLTRDIDQKTQALVFIDFKSLGVRQLGSIYEGLLEFKLKIAAEKLAVTKSKGKEVYQPAKKVKGNRAIATLEKGDVYLENDKQERKATGSYYTPDYIVKYIVRHTVGPVLDRQFTACEPRLRNAQKGYRDYAKLVEARRKSSGKDESPTVYWNNPEMQQLVDDCLNVRVLDPAMGSGHFLVEVVDYISNRLIDFLNGWSENPVWHFIDQTRQDILDDMERQGVSIDPDRLTRVALLKRAVLKRCVYGVDLNLMAVELAKVSLWLDAFTLGAPLSFLDHHLKHGNSLIGARVADVQEYLHGGDGPQQIDMFARSQWTGLMMATDLMRQVSYLTDNTIAQANSSKAHFEQALAHLISYKRILDVYTSRWFGNDTAKKSKTDNLLLLLKQSDIEHWLKDTDYQLDTSLLPAANEMAQTALQAAEEKRFFHWELEFPEVFFAPSKPGGQDVQLRKDGGFDAVVGNPPYGHIGDSVSFDYTTERFKASAGRADIYSLFYEVSFEIASQSGRVAYVTPNTWFARALEENFRQYVLSNMTIEHLQEYAKQVFADAPDVVPVVAVIQPTKPDPDHSVKVQALVDKPLEYWLRDGIWKVSGVAKQSRWLSTEQFAINPVNTEESLEIIDKVSSVSAPFEEVVDTSPVIVVYGYKGESDEKDYILPERRNDTYKPLLRGKDISRFELEETGEYVSYGPWLFRSRQEKYFNQKKLMWQHVRKLSMPTRLVATIDTEGIYYPISNINSAIPVSDYSLEYLLAIFNSSTLNFWYAKKYHRVDITTETVKTLPIRRIDFTTPADERERLVGEITGAYDLGDTAGALSRVRAALAAGQTDVVHDVLAHLAQTMIDLNKQKQAEVGRFLGWLEDKLKIKPDDKGRTSAANLSGTTGRSFADFLGDYQKGQPHLPFGTIGSAGKDNDFAWFLYKNKNRFSVSLTDVAGELEREYEASLEKLLPVKDQLASTDALIDKIVYRLYGLTDAEIELIERPGYEQALTDAKAQVVGDDKIDDEEKLEKIAEGILPVAKRFFERVTPDDVEAALDGELPNWRDLPPDAPVFLLTGDYNLRSLPDHMDFSSSVIPYTKAVEVVLDRLVFQPFRASSYTDKDCHNTFLQKFMRGEKSLTLGSYMIILSSSKETALRSTMQYTIPDVDGFVTVLTDEAMRDVRNKAAHDEVLSRDEARQARAWAVGILGMV